MDNQSNLITTVILLEIIFDGVLKETRIRVKSKVSPSIIALCVTSVFQSLKSIQKKNLTKALRSVEI